MIYLCQCVLSRLHACCLALQALFELLGNNGYRMTEAEVKVFMPGLVEKCGQPQPNVRTDCRSVAKVVAVANSAALSYALCTVQTLEQGLWSATRLCRGTHLLQKAVLQVYMASMANLMHLPSALLAYWAC